MKKTVCELFAGVGGFRCGLNNIKTSKDYGKKEKWDTVWFSQWEPAEKKTQYAHDCYVYRFGTCLDKNGEDTTNYNIEEVDKSTIPDFNLLVGGFPCQDYSVASSLATSKGLEGKKGILWWSIRETVEKKQPPFILLENVDRLLKSPAKQRGRDFGIILACLRDEGYTVEWRVINAAEYGYQQRRRRTFIFAYRNDTKYAEDVADAIQYINKSKLEENRQSMNRVLVHDGFFAETFPVYDVDSKQMKIVELPEGIGELSEEFEFNFENTGVMKDGVVQQVDTPQNLYTKPCNLFVAGFIGSPQMNFLDAEVKVNGSDVTLSVGGHELPVPADKKQALIDKGYAGKTVILGIRPEDVHVAATFTGENAGTVHSTINVYELLGAEVFLYFDVAGTQVTARVGSGTELRSGDKASFTFDMSKIHIFDKETELTISN